MVNTMARRTDGGVRFRPVGSRRSRTAPVYSPRGTGCPAIEQAVERLYQGQSEETFWTLMSALNYALELETHVLVPLQAAATVHPAPACGRSSRKIFSSMQRAPFLSALGVILFREQAG